MKLLEVSRVAPANSAADIAELTHPLSFLDLYLFKLPPTGRLFFYSVPGLDRTRFTDSVVPKLKDSLALTLLHYLPLAGNILWPPSSAKPLLCYRPGDAVSFSVSESDADFHHLSGRHVCDTAEFHKLAPILPASHDVAPVLAVAVTLFPTAGFCVGTTAHHAIFDGNSTTMFRNSWAHICNNLVNGSAEPDLPPELRPVFDRTAIEEKDGGRGLGMVNLRQWMAATERLSEGNPRNLVVLQVKNHGTADLVSGTFELTPANIEKLRNRVTKAEHYVSGSPRLSTFVLSTAYVAVQELKAMALATPSGDGENRAVVILIPVDYRNRMETPVPANYIGNCVVSHILEVEDHEFKNADGFARLAVKMSGAIRELEKGVLRGAERRLENLMKTLSKNRVIGIAASNRFGVYRLDLGWRRPEKVVVESLYSAGHIAVAESTDGTGGVEIAVLLTNLQMQHFRALFADGLNSP